MKRSFKTYCFIALFLAVVVSYQNTTAADETPREFGNSEYLGILEDVPRVYFGEHNSRKLRVVFKKVENEWKASSKSNSEITWTITFNGKKLGVVKTQPQKTADKWLSDSGLHYIMSNTPVPTIGERSIEYSGFIGKKVYRPLVATSQPYFQDNEHWKTSKLSAELTTLVRQQFRGKFPKVQNCANPAANIARPWLYQDIDVKIVKTYSSNTGWIVVQALLSENRCDFTDDDAFFDQWFVISPAKKVTFLDQGMWLVDAGDYDNDGKSELVFAINRYNTGGYALFYDDFKKRAVFEFSYH